MFYLDGYSRQFNKLCSLVSSKFKNTFLNKKIIKISEGDSSCTTKFLDLSTLQIGGVKSKVVFCCLPISLLKNPVLLKGCKINKLEKFALSKLNFSCINILYIQFVEDLFPKYKFFKFEQTPFLTFINLNYYSEGCNILLVKISPLFYDNLNKLAKKNLILLESKLVQYILKLVGSVFKNQNYNKKVVNYKLTTWNIHLKSINFIFYKIFFLNLLNIYILFLYKI